jgi:GH24 family phage-related lysozyme (muramidase)
MGWFKQIVEQKRAEEEAKPKEAPAQKAEAVRPATTTYRGWLPSRDLVQKIVDWETGGPRFYNRYLTTPEKPANDSSGLTVGVGYDLGYSTPDQVKADWKGYISDEDITKLASVAGLKGREAAGKHREVVGVTISYEVALAQFTKVTLPIWLIKAYQLWPNFDALNDRQKTALVSLTYNRGTSLIGSTRSEMKEVYENLERGNTRPVAGLIKQMALRSPLKGVQLRRKQEGELFAS